MPVDLVSATDDPLPPSPKGVAGYARAVAQLLKEAASSWLEDDAPSMGAALSYYTVFSIAPLLLIAISVAGLVFGEEAARGEIMAQLSGLIGTESAKTIEGMLQAASEPAMGTLGTVVGLFVLLVGATTVFAELETSLNRIWRTPDRPNVGGLWGFLRARLLSLGMILGIGFLIMVSLVFSAALAALGKWWVAWFGGWVTLASVLNVLVSFGFVTAGFAMIYKWMPRVHLVWRDVWVGAFLTALLFTLGKAAISLYIGRSGVASVFGAAGSLVVVLLWVYYSAQIFLFGAEMAWVYARRWGSLRGLREAPLAP
jgi:membrane protein